MKGCWELNLKNKLGPKLYYHSLGVKKAAVDLADCYGADSRKASIAGILHDYGKILSPKSLLRYAKKWGMKIDEVIIVQPDLLHGPVGAHLIQLHYNINDVEILEAVKVHTTGRKNMGLLAKIIYLADYIEAGRDYPGVEKLRELAFKDIDRAILMATDQTIKYILKNGWLIHPDSIFFRNDLLFKQKMEGI